MDHHPISIVENHRFGQTQCQSGFTTEKWGWNRANRNHHPGIYVVIIQQIHRVWSADILDTLYETMIWSRCRTHGRFGPEPIGILWNPYIPSKMAVENHDGFVANSLN